MHPSSNLFRGSLSVATTGVRGRRPRLSDGSANRYDDLPRWVARAPLSSDHVPTVRLAKRIGAIEALRQHTLV